MLVDSLNLSTKFINNELGDPINYKTYIHNVENSENLSDIPNRFKNKERTIKERSSINSFRIYDNNLKKITNPSDIYDEEIKRIIEEENQKKVEISKKPYIQPSWIISNPNNSQKENLINVIESQVNLLKEETEANLKLNSSHISNGAKQNTDINDFSSLNEPHVDTHFFNNDNGVFQSFKHVRTQNKPEYMSIEQISQMREANAKKLIELEKEYKIAKDKEKLQKFREEQEKMNKKFNYKPEILDELKEILKRENELFHFDKKKKKRPKSTNSINVGDKKKVKNINKSQEKYVKKFAKYQVNKKMNKLEKEKEKINNKPWNYTKIESKNTLGVVERDDNLPGYLGKVDLSLYYYDITDEKNKTPEKFKAPHWESVTRIDLLKEGKFNVNNVSNGEIYHENKNEEINKNFDDKNEDIKNVPEKEKNEIAKIEKLADNITKDIFDYFNQEFIFGLVTKSQITTEFNFEPDELGQLKFSSKSDFIKVLENFHTDLYNRMNYEELKKCLLSKINENQKTNNNLNNILINQNKTNKNNENNLKTENIQNNNIENLNYENININKENENNDNKLEENIDMDNSNLNDDENENEKEISEEDNNEDYLPVYNTKNIIINYVNTNKRLEEANKLLYQLEGPHQGSTEMEEDSLEIKIDLDVDKDNPKEVNYFDYKKVINKYSDKNSINFTIPKPFIFQEDTKSKINGVKKLQKFLISRKEKEDKILNDKFRANDLKTEMFIGNINNLLEADKNAKRKRIEKGMKKLQEQMCPFSFVPEDEEKQKIKMEKQKIYETTKEHFDQFKANPIKHTSRGGLNAEDIVKKENKIRDERIRRHAKKTLSESKMPPGMEKHEKNQKMKRKKLMEEEKKRQKKEEKEQKKKKNLDPPNWNKVHKIEEKKLEKKKKINNKIKNEKATKIKEFNLHDGLKKENMYQKYVENGAEYYKEPSLKRNINKFEAEYEKIQNE